MIKKDPAGAGGVVATKPKETRRSEIERHLEVNVAGVGGAAVVGEGLLDVVAGEVVAHAEFEVGVDHGIPADHEIEFLAQLAAGAAGGVAAAGAGDAGHVIPIVVGGIEELDVVRKSCRF